MMPGGLPRVNAAHLRPGGQFQVGNVVPALPADKFVFHLRSGMVEFTALPLALGAASRRSHRFSTSVRLELFISRAARARWAVYYECGVGRCERWRRRWPSPLVAVLQLGKLDAFGD